MACSGSNDEGGPLRSLAICLGFLGEGTKAAPFRKSYIVFVDGDVRWSPMQSKCNVDFPKKGC